MCVNGPKKQHFELLKDGAKEEFHISYWYLVTVVIMPVQIKTHDSESRGQEEAQQRDH